MAKYVRITTVCRKCGTESVVMLTRKQIKELYRAIKQPGEMGAFKV
jgi:hypothetical protein